MPIAVKILLKNVKIFAKKRGFSDEIAEREVMQRRIRQQRLRENGY